MPETRVVDSWEPVDGVVLEPAALRVVRDLGTYLVAAGPGAGKTELLAQRACFLLQTGKCPSPRQILAISFKVDAAKNLSDRVGKRCGKQLSRRFVSLTYAAFAKQILDQFRMALPGPWAPNPDYEVVTSVKPLADFVRSTGVTLTRYEMARFKRDHAPFPLPMGREDPEGNRVDRVIYRLWQSWLFETDKARLTFPMISRLAGFILQNTPPILRGLQAAYSHVFLDEFQDTTGQQFDLVDTAFREAATSLTAVGDDRQRIMVWAGALPDAFERFADRFRAKRESLLLNHRSAPRLVDVQRVFACELDPEAALVSSGPSAPREGICEVHYFASPEHEAMFLAERVAELAGRGARPRDICILVKNKAPTYARQLIDALSAKGVKARIEQELQDLLAEPVIEVVLDALVLATREQDADAWSRLSDLVLECRGIANEDQHASIDSEVEGALEQLAQSLRHSQPEGDVSANLEFGLATFIKFIGEDTFREAFPQYRQGGWMEENLRELARHLTDRRLGGMDWRGAVDDLLGADAIPVMTIHKSKGLEYDTVIFLGLEDGAFWSFREQRDEDSRAFFVALSRAKRQVIFTFSEWRDSGREGKRVRERAAAIKRIYELLQQAGVGFRDHVPP